MHIFSNFAEAQEIERLEPLLLRLARRVDSGPRSLAYAALAARVAENR